MILQVLETEEFAKQTQNSTEVDLFNKIIRSYRYIEDDVNSRLLNTQEQKQTTKITFVVCFGHYGTTDQLLHKISIVVEYLSSLPFYCVFVVLLYSPIYHYYYYSIRLS